MVAGGGQPAHGLRLSLMEGDRGCRRAPRISRFPPDFASHGFTAPGPSRYHLRLDAMPADPVAREAAPIFHGKVRFPSAGARCAFGCGGVRTRRWPHPGAVVSTDIAMPHRTRAMHFLKPAMCAIRRSFCIPPCSVFIKEDRWTRTSAFRGADPAPFRGSVTVRLLNGPSIHASNFCCKADVDEQPVPTNAVQRQRDRGLRRVSAKVHDATVFSAALR